MPRKTPPQYVVATVEAVILEIAAELHPKHLPAGELAGKVIAHPDDAREVETAARAIRNLRKFELLRERGDKKVEPTKAALHAVALLT